MGKHVESKDRRLDDNYPTFQKFNRTLRWTCETGDPAILEITPNSSWPDVVYYNSFTHANMGWKIRIFDSAPPIGAGSQFMKMSSSTIGVMLLLSVGTLFVSWVL